jgi:hypothetical protein
MLASYWLYKVGIGGESDRTKKRRRELVWLRKSVEIETRLKSIA